jgi:hypothetical protein
MIGISNVKIVLMEKLKVLYGLILGFLLAGIGLFLFLELFTEYGLKEGISAMIFSKSLGKLISIGCVLNLCAFFLLLYMQQELMARGVVLATMLIGIATIFI